MQPHRALPVSQFTNSLVSQFPLRCLEDALHFCLLRFLQRLRVVVLQNPIRLFPIEVAREKTDWVLENHRPEPLEEAQRSEIKRILQAAERELG